MLTDCHEDLPNPHAIIVRNILSNLICHDNDLRRLSTDIKRLQDEFNSEVEKIEQRCAELRKPPAQRSVRLLTISQQLVTIDEVNEIYKTQIEKLQAEKCDLIIKTKECMQALMAEKLKLRNFHENTIDYIKRATIQSDDLIKIHAYEKDICEMQRLYVKEITYIKQCEVNLMPLFQKLGGFDFHDYCNQCCFKDFDWIPPSKNLGIVDDISQNIKTVMGPTLRSAFSKLHVQQHPDPKSYLAAYLLNLVQNEELVREKLDLFGGI